MAMFQLTLSKQTLLTPLLTVAGAVDKKQSNAILSNILLQLNGNQLIISATDLDIAMTACIPCELHQGEGSTTVPAKKMIDIIRLLDDDATPTLSYANEVISIKSGRSQFKLSTLCADDFPDASAETSRIEFSIAKESWLKLLQSTHFALSQQDVRVFLNSLLLDIDSKGITTVATDGHRMALCRYAGEFASQHERLLLPRKSIQEVIRLLNTITDETITISAGQNYFKLVSQSYTFFSKLIDARFPSYTKAIPRDQDKRVIIDRDVLKRSLSRIIILAHEKSRAVLLHVQAQQITLIANNHEREEAIESIEVITEGDELKIGINAGYLLDVLNHIKEGPLRLSLSETDCSILVESLSDMDCQYIIMPMKI